MNTTFYTLKKTYKYLEELNIHPEINALWDLLHIIRWHKGIDWVMWINNNKELVNKITQYKTRIDFPTDLNEKVWDSVYKIKKLDR
jgi:hypothetical protein